MKIHFLVDLNRIKRRWIKKLIYSDATPEEKDASLEAAMIACLVDESGAYMTREAALEVLDNLSQQEYGEVSMQFVEAFKGAIVPFQTAAS